MAIYNEILAPRYSRMLQKLFSMKGPQATKQLGGEFLPVIPIFYGAEMRYLEGWVMHSVETVLSASPANLNAIELRNPPLSGVIVVVQRILCACGVTGDSYILSMGPKTTDLPTPLPIASPSAFDRRWGTQVSPLIASIQQAAGPGTAPPDRLFTSIPANTAFEFVLDTLHEFPVLPGDAIALRSQTVNNASAYSIWWRERPLEDSEKS